MYKRILVPIDGSVAANKGLEEAIRLAAGLHATLVLLHIVNEQPAVLDTASGTAFGEVRRQMLKDGDKVLGDASQWALDAGVPSEAVLKELITGRVADAIVAVAAHTACDLIVMGTHGRRGMPRLVLGSDAELVVRESPVPVMLVRRPPPEALSN
jgi:nucleotide-binding universal stress UspA family protein